MKHYPIVDDKKYCPDCKRWLPLNNFYQWRRSSDNKLIYDGHCMYCRCPTTPFKRKLAGEEVEETPAWIKRRGPIWTDDKRKAQPMGLPINQSTWMAQQDQ